VSRSPGPGLRMDVLAAARGKKSRRLFDCDASRVRPHGVGSVITSATAARNELAAPRRATKINGRSLVLGESSK
jgi:hypothetical protein